MAQDINCVFEGLGSAGAIYISNFVTAQNSTLLKNLNIQAVLTVARTILQPQFRQGISDYLLIEADDLEDFDIYQHFQKSFQFIDAARKNTNILVHCQAGISRSPTIVIAYLLKKYSYSLSQVYNFVKRRRNINLNKGFTEQLNRYAKECNSNDSGISTFNRTSNRSKYHSEEKKQSIKQPNKIKQTINSNLMEKLQISNNHKHLYKIVGEKISTQNINQLNYQAYKTQPNKIKEQLNLQKIKNNNLQNNLFQYKSIQKFIKNQQSRKSLTRKGIINISSNNSLDKSRYKSSELPISSQINQIKRKPKKQVTFFLEESQQPQKKQLITTSKKINKKQQLVIFIDRQQKKYLDNLLKIKCNIFSGRIL